MRSTHPTSRHLRKHAQWGKDGLLFPTTHGEQYRAPTFHQAYFRKAREAAGRPDLRFHDLRHTGATMTVLEHPAQDWGASEDACGDGE